jgi:hypothetical protein
MIDGLLVTDFPKDFGTTRGTQFTAIKRAKVCSPRTLVVHVLPMSVKS